jgi:hypothetical protein
MKKFFSSERHVSIVWDIETVRLPPNVAPSKLVEILTKPEQWKGGKVQSISCFCTQGFLPPHIRQQLQESNVSLQEVVPENNVRFLLFTTLLSELFSKSLSVAQSSEKKKDILMLITSDPYFARFLHKLRTEEIFYEILLIHDLSSCSFTGAANRTLKWSDIIRQVESPDISNLISSAFPATYTYRPFGQMEKKETKINEVEEEKKINVDHVQKNEYYVRKSKQNEEFWKSKKDQEAYLLFQKIIKECKVEKLIPRESVLRGRVDSYLTPIKFKNNKIFTLKKERMGKARLQFDKWIDVLAKMGAILVEGEKPQRIFWPKEGPFECADYFDPQVSFSSFFL